MKAALIFYYYNFNFVCLKFFKIKTWEILKMVVLKQEFWGNIGKLRDFLELGSMEKHGAADWEKVHFHNTRNPGAVTSP